MWSPPVLASRDGRHVRAGGLTRRRPTASSDPIPFTAVLRIRNRAYHRLPGLRVRSAAEARRFVRRVGFCLFWPTKGVEAPSLLHAIAGRALPPGGNYHHPAFGRSWNWKDEALDKRWWYYGRLIRGRATLVSRDWLPAFYALSENYGDPSDYLLEYQDGRLSAEAKAVYEALLLQGPMDTVRLRKEARLAGEAAKSRFQRAMVELQGGLKILPVGVAEAGAWDYAFTYDLVSRWFPEVDEAAHSWTTSRARHSILVQHLTNLGAASIEEARRFLGWPAPVLAHALQTAVEARDVEPVAVVDSGGTRTLMTTPAAGRRLRREAGAGRRPRSRAGAGAARRGR